MRSSRLIIAGAAALALVAAGCGSDAPETSSLPEGDGLAAGACLAGAEDCQDTGGDMSAPPLSAMCAEDEPDCDDTVSVSNDGEGSLPVNDAADDEADPRFVEPSDGLSDVHAVSWYEATVDQDDNAITVTWWSGVEPCTVFSEATVDLGEDTITVTILEGTDTSGGEDQACIEIAELKGYRIQLDQPIGDRTIVDGAEA